MNAPEPTTHAPAIASRRALSRRLAPALRAGLLALPALGCALLLNAQAQGDAASKAKPGPKLSARAKHAAALLDCAKAQPQTPGGAEARDILERMSALMAGAAQVEASARTPLECQAMLEEFRRLNAAEHAAIDAWAATRAGQLDIAQPALQAAPQPTPQP